jgi:hypothetical protein
MLFVLCEVRSKFLYVFKTRSDQSHPLNANETSQIHWKQQWNNNVTLHNLIISLLQPCFCLPISPRAFFISSSYAFYRVTAILGIYRSFATIVTQPKICDFSGEIFKTFWSSKIFYECNDNTNCSQAESFANCVMTLYLLKVQLQTFFFCTNNSKMLKFWVVTLSSQMSDMSTPYPTVAFNAGCYFIFLWRSRSNGKARGS